MKKTILCTLLIFFRFSGAFAQSTDTLFKSSVQEVMKIGVKENYNAVSSSLATRSERTVEETPSVMSVISQKEIEAWGCRDLADILRLVPGFEFGVDVNSLYGFGFRGIWAYEGKALIMINGLMVNCLTYGNSNFFGTYPAAMIEKVEIIRGPGSALYGGFAEVAVINVLTKKRETSVQSHVGVIGKDLAYGGNISLGIQKDATTSLSVQVGSQFSPMSNRTYEDVNGNSFEMGAESSWRKWQHVIVQAQFKKLSVSYNRTQTNWLAQDAAFSLVPRNQHGIYTHELTNFMQSLHLKYELPIGDKFLIQPQIEMANGNPIAARVNPAAKQAGRVNSTRNASDYWQNQSVLGRRYAAELNGYYKNKDDEIIIGLGYQINAVEGIGLDGRPGLRFSPNPADTVRAISRDASFALFQYIRKIKDFNFIVGSRYEITPFGNALAPRLGITWNHKAFHSKVLYGRAFRVPQLFQVFSRLYFVGEKLKPEITNTIEIETGYQFSENLKASLNAFWIDIDSPLTYIGLSSSYQNYGRVGSVGIEGELNWRNKQHGAFLNFSYMRPTGNTSLDFVSQNQNAFLAMPNLKLNGGFYYQYKKLTFSPTFTYLGERQGQTLFSAQNTTDTKVIFQTQSYKALLLLNLNISLRKILKHLDLSLQIHNLTNSPYIVLQPYYGGHAPLPVADRQISISVNYVIE